MVPRRQQCHCQDAHDKNLLQRQTDTTDKQIDQLVYELYGLTSEEIRFVEEATK